MLFLRILVDCTYVFVRSQNRVQQWCDQIQPHRNECETNAAAETIKVRSTLLNASGTIVW